ncbi:MAG: zf-TFIIB domain-containing protein [Planctomycetes bacterium]|nr:zf-TFIIB domain-containing protein [Planctomycetota bacterium]
MSNSDENDSDESEPTGRCPVCPDHPDLEGLLDRDVEFRGCITCFGLFVHADALSQYVCNAVGDEDAVTAYDDLLVTALKKQGGPSKRVCPVCEEPMRRLGFGEAPFMILDRCENGHGLWLDKRELKKVVRTCRAQTAVLGLMPPPGREEDDDSVD